MKVVVIGGSGLIGSQVVGILGGQGHEAVAASPSSGVNTLTGEGVERALAGAAGVRHLVRATQFLEFAPAIAGMATAEDGKAHLPTAYIQPIAGPQRFGLDEFVRPAVPGVEVVTDESAGYAGVQVQPTSLVPGGEATLGEITLAAWQEAQR